MTADKVEGDTRAPRKHEHRHYKRWASMICRCTYPGHRAFKYYGGKNPPVTVCDRWRDFDAFLADMEEGFIEGLTIERVENSKGYSPDNCIWATRAQQVKNRSMTLAIEYQGRTQNGSEWAKEYGLHPDVFRMRLKIGWSIERALKTPVKSSIKTPTPR